MAQWVKSPPTVQETQEIGVPSLGWEDALEKEMAHWVGSAVCVSQVT